MKQLLVILSLLSTVACNRKPFVEHKISIARKAIGCETVGADFKMISNIGGERFEFEKCLPAFYDKKMVDASRRGDTVVVSFPKLGGSERMTYKITLDIDSYPRYNYITIDEDTYTVIPSSN